MMVSEMLMDPDMNLCFIHDYSLDNEAARNMDFANLFPEPEHLDLDRTLDFLFPPEELNMNEFLNDFDGIEDVDLCPTSGSWNDISSEGLQDSSDNPMMCLVNPDELLRREDDDSEEEDDSKKYHPRQDHNYTNLTEEDVWTKPTSMYSMSDPSPPRSKLNCRHKAKAATQVSITRACQAVLKSQGGRKRPSPSISNMTTRKQRKFSNSVETTPSGSDSEELMKYKPVPPPQKKGGRRGAPLKKSAKPTKSEVQRNTHNENEKARREYMASMMKAVKEAIPVEFYRDKSDQAKLKASKQKVLQAAKSYVLYLRENEDYDEEETRIIMERKYELNCVNEALNAARAKKARFVKKWTDKYLRIIGRHYKPNSKPRGRR